MNIFFLSLFMFDLDVDVIGRYRTIGSHAFEQSLYSTLYIGYGIPNNLRNMAHTLQIPNDLWNAAHTLLLDFCVLNTNNQRNGIPITPHWFTVTSIVGKINERWQIGLERVRIVRNSRSVDRDDCLYLG